MFSTVVVVVFVIRVVLILFAIVVAVVALVAHGRLHVACTFSCSSWAMQKRLTMTAKRYPLATCHTALATTVNFFFPIHPNP